MISMKAAGVAVQSSLAASNGLFARAVGIIEARIGLVSNNQDLTTADEFLSIEAQRAKPTIWSFLTAMPTPEPMPFDPAGLDSYFYVLDQPNVEPDFIQSGNKCICFGDFTRHEASQSDRRWNIYGNVGIFYAYSLATLERYRGIHSFHASALYSPERNLLLIVLGSSGSGKTVLQLEALLYRDFQVFTTEMTHFRIDGDTCTFFKGSVYDNIRIGNLVYDFPEAISRFNVKVPEVEDSWETYLAVDFAPWSTKETILVNPKVVLLFPKIESSRKELILNTNPGRGSVLKAMFENASEKICKSAAMYGGYPAVASFDSQHLAAKRLAAVEKLLDSPIVQAKIKLQGGPKDCWAWDQARRCSER
jgi:hypothetical protein